MIYFFDCFEDPISLEIVESHDRKFFRDFNSDLKENPKCSANKICRNNENEIMAVKCNCCKKTYHPVFNGKVNWKCNISAKNIMSLKKISIEKLRWILED
jgi:hypothetical protein